MTAIWLLACGLGAAGAQRTPASQVDRTSVPVVSVERVRAALAKPPSKLTLHERTPDFKVSISERERFERLLTPILDFKLGPGFPQSALFASPFGSRPVFSVDLLSAALATVSVVNEVRRARAKHAQVEEVRLTIAAYCAAQPHGGAGITICDARRTLDKNNR